MSQQPQTISINDLDAAQLADIKKQLDDVSLVVKFLRQPTDHTLQELHHLTSSFAQLKQAQAKFKACIDNINEVKPQNKGEHSRPIGITHSNTISASDKVILVPLTNSLYVPGKLSDVEHVIVDVGTGYFVKKVVSPLDMHVPQLIKIVYRRDRKPSNTTTKRWTISRLTSKHSKRLLERSERTSIT